MAGSSNQPHGHRPPIFEHPLSFLLLTSIWAGCLFGGAYLIFKIYPVIAVILTALYVYLVIRQSRFNSDRARAERIVRAYDKVCLYRPEADIEAVFTEALRIYLREEGFDENHIAAAVSVVLEAKEGVRSLDDFVSGVLSYESPVFSSSRNFNSTIKKFMKRKRIVDAILARRENNNRPQLKRPELSKRLVQRLELEGFRVDELSVEQVLALDAMENPERYHWFAREAGWIAYGLGFFALLELFKLNLLLSAVLGAVSVGIMYLVYKTQTTRAMRMFQQASIRKYAEDRRM